MSVNQADVRKFYDAFLYSRMLDYRLFGNERIKRAAARIRPEIGPENRVLDIGCGIGIVAETVAKRAVHGHVWAVDISEKNIWYARKTVTNGNVTFLQGDIVLDFDAIARQIGETIDVVTMVDVIEHLPVEARPSLFRNLRSIGSPNVTIVATYPSPQYQRYLKDHEPAELQVIDNAIELSDLLLDVEDAGFSIRHYSLETVWRKNQYVHCILQADDAVGDIGQNRPRTLLDRAVRRLRTEVRDRVVVKIRRRKYVDRVFGLQR